MVEQIVQGRAALLCSRLTGVLAQTLRTRFSQCLPLGGERGSFPSLLCGVDSDVAVNHVALDYHLLVSVPFLRVLLGSDI